MKIATRRLLLRAATAAAVACTAALILMPGVASAATATATAKGNVDVYERARESSQLVDTLANGEIVTVQGCRQGWCYITHTGPDGFVQAANLRRNGGAMQPDFNLTFAFPQGSFTIGSGGVSIGIGNPPPYGSPNYRKVCFFTGKGYTGDSFCLDRGAAKAYVGNQWNNRISSFRNPSGLTVRVCSDAGYDGTCRTYSTSASSLGSLDNQISSIRIK
ncbi:MAG: peptidase inhibitor family I36 protein [Devosia sp.]